MTLNSSLMSSKSPEWETPQAFFERLDAEFGFTLDAAASSENTKCRDFYAIRDNALWQSWPGIVWCNPPYGRLIGKFVRKAYQEAQRGSTVVMLIPSRTDTHYWHNYVMQAKEIRFVRGRLCFAENGNRGSEPAPFPSAVIVFKQGQYCPKISTMDAN